MHASRFFRVVYQLLSMYENEAFLSHTNARISDFEYGLEASSMIMKPLSSIQIYASPFLRWFTSLHG